MVQQGQRPETSQPRLGEWIKKARAGYVPAQAAALGAETDEQSEIGKGWDRLEKNPEPPGINGGAK